ncbi:MAG: hypothetical protein ACRC7H_06575 [Plesiomonas shigelloides]
MNKILTVFPATPTLTPFFPTLIELVTKGLNRFNQGQKTGTKQNTHDGETNGQGKQYMNQNQDFPRRGKN